MNLRQIDDFLERHSAGWKPFKGDFKISKGSFKNNPIDDLFGKGSGIGKWWNEAARDMNRMGGKIGDKVGMETNITSERTRQEEEVITAAKKAAHDAEVAQLSQQALGSVTARRRRGSYATRLTGSSGQAQSGKTLLSQ